MHILLLEPFFTGSHAAWAQEYQHVSSHEISILSLSGHHWKWRMHGGAVTLARQFLESELKPDLILATDMLDLTTFLALTRKRTANIPTVLYFHENQLTYPRSAQDQDVQLRRDHHYSFINFTSALTADWVCFNSKYHFDAFFEALPRFLKQFPDHKELDAVEEIQQKSEVLPLGLDLKVWNRFRQYRNPEQQPLILWNHRWEHDKNPETFFEILFELAEEGVDFEVAVLGERFPRVPKVFAEAKQRLGSRIVQWGYAETLEEYAQWLWRADIIPVCSNHDFFGSSVVQAMYCDTYPLLPHRLAYPEHIPPEFHEKHLYDSTEEMRTRLRDCLKNINHIRQVRTQDWVGKYDWGNMAEIYDTFFEKPQSSQRRRRGRGDKG